MISLLVCVYIANMSIIYAYRNISILTDDINQDIFCNNTPHLPGNLAPESCLALPLVSQINYQQLPRTIINSNIYNIIINI